jgi:serine/threonine-protein kinase
VDDACDRFEKDWRRRPRIEDYLGDAGGRERAELLRELILLEVELRRQAGEQAATEEYHARFPAAELGAAADASTEPAPSPWGRPAAAPRAAHGCELLEEIGRGGIGVVHRGRDPGLRRELAVKVLRDEHRGNADLVRRFMEEAQIAGQLQHPGVAPVYELGEFPDRRPYFTMKLVRGRTLADLLGARERPGGDLPRWLAVFEQVCRTLAYAHANRVIHRDLKPHNVMVGEFGEAQVMDWGMAKVLASRGRQPPEEITADPAALANSTIIDTLRRDAPEAASHYGAVMGTLAYMPPEQATGDVARQDERCDVFGLGAILCEILTGQPPYTGTREEVRRKASEGDLRDALARLEGCGADPELVRIARACLAADPADRPRNAGAASEAVTAYLEGVQERLKAADAARVEERARGLHERQRRFWAAALSTSLALTLAVLAGGGWWVQRREAEADRARADADRKAAETRAEADREAAATRAEADQRSAAEAAAAEADLQEASRLIDQADWGHAREAIQRAKGRLGEFGPDELRRRVRRLETDMDLVAALEEVRMRESELKEGHFDWEGVDAEFAAKFAAWGLDFRTAAPAEAAERVRASATWDRLVDLLDYWVAVKRLAKADGRDRLLAVVRLADPDDAPRQMLRDEAVLADPAKLKELAGRPEVADWPPEAADLLALALSGVGERDTAVEVLRQAQRLHPDDFWLNLDLAFQLNRTKPARPEEALGFDRAAVALRRKAAAAHNNLGAALERQGNPEEAEGEYREAIRLKSDLPVAHYNLGFLLSERGKAGEAQREYREAIRLQPDYPAARNNLVALLRREGRPEEAEREAREAIRLRPDDAEAHNNLGAALQVQANWAEAEKEYRETVRLNPKHPEAHYNLGILLQLQNKSEEAEAEYREAVRLKPDVPEAHYNLGYMLTNRGQAAEAEREYREALRGRPDFAQAHCNLGILLRDGGRLREALTELRRGDELGSRDPKWPYHSAARVKDCERLVECDALLPAVSSGAARPADADAASRFTRVCRYTRRYTAAVGLYADLLADNPKAADDPRTGLRYNAACFAALAGCGEGNGAPPGDADRARLRAQALEWLRADLSGWAKDAAGSDPAAVAAARQALQRWREDADLAGVRDKPGLENLPQAEREKWRLLWEKVDALQKAAAPK